jgi:exopolysaccharide biosynthesis WecB/TagA/CpsF family protein
LSTIDHDLERIDVLGVPVLTAEPPTARRAVAQACLAQDEPVKVAYANAHSLNLASTDPAFRSALQGFEFVFNDGAGVSLAARVQGRPVPANLNGSDFTPLLLELAVRQGWSVFFLGGRPGTAERAAGRLATRFPELRVAGTAHGYFEPEQSAAVVASVRRSGADVLIVAMGNPLQELWLEEHLAATGALMGVAVGAFLDFAAGNVPRAPRWMNRLGIEWLYRLAQEPRRMWRRYVVGNPLFVMRVLTEQLRGRAAEPAAQTT